MPFDVKKKLMQRLSSWLEQLPLPRRSTTRNSTRTRHKTSRSAAPAVRCQLEIVSGDFSFRAPPPTRDPPPVPKRAPETKIGGMSTSLIYADPWERLPRGRTTLREDLPMGGSLSQATGRQTIRTNPWISRSSLRASSHHSTMRTPMTSSVTSSGPSLSPSSSTSSPYDPSSSRLNIKSLDESVCSSGYGSQDSSPESSVHSPNWQQTRQDKAVECRSIDLDAELGYLEETSSFGPYDEMRDEDEEGEHVYHELESLARFSRVLEESRVPSSLSSGSVSLPRNKDLPISLQSPIISSSSSSARSARPSSPVYARPFEIRQLPKQQQEEYFYPASLPNSYFATSSFSPVPVGDSIPRRPRQLPLAPPPQQHHYSRPAPKFHAPPPPPLNEGISASFAPAQTSSNQEWGMSREEAQLRKIEQDFLAELDAQIQELQLKSEAVRCMVDEARVRRASTEQWRRARWHNTFELCL